MGLRTASFVEVVIDAATGADTENEHHETFVPNFVHHPVAADTDPTPTGRAGQGHRADRPRFLAQGTDRFEHTPPGGNVEPSNLPAG